MAQWGTTDNAANSVNFAALNVNLPANSANKTALFGNTTPDAFVDGQSVGVFGVGPNEVAAQRGAGGPRAAHAGWVLRTEGTGGRAGRVQQEVLVALTGGITGDAADDLVAPDFAVIISAQPEAVTTNNSVNASYSVEAETIPSGGTLTYLWQLANGSTIPGGAVVGNTSTTDLVVNTEVQSSNTAFKVEIGVAGGANVLSANASLIITV